MGHETRDVGHEIGDTRHRARDTNPSSRSPFSVVLPHAPDPTPQPSQAEVLVVVSQIPCYTEAFILRELYALSKLTDIAIFSLRKSKDKVIHDQAAELLDRTVYVGFLSWKVILASIKMLCTRPLKTLGALYELVRGNLGDSEFLFKNLVLFPKALYLADWSAKNKVTHLHGYWATYPASVAMTVSRITGIPLSFTGHAHDIYLKTTHLREKIAVATFVGTCTVSNKTHLLEVAKSARPEKILINHHGLDLSLFEVSDKKRNACFQILSVGTLEAHKGFDHLLNALALLKAKQLNFHCTIIGGGPLEADLRKLIEMLGLQSNVTMTGALKQTQVIPFHKGADVSVLMAQSSWHWGIPNVIIESLAAKAAVITTHFGSVSELVVEGETGLFVEGQNPEKLAEALERFYRDDVLRVRTAEAGARVVHAEFDLKKNIEEFKRRLTNCEVNPRLWRGPVRRRENKK